MKHSAVFRHRDQLPLDNLVDLLSTFFGALDDPGMVAVYLFGSRVSGNLHRDSDVDLAVLLDRRLYPDERHRFEARLGWIAQLEPSVGGAGLDLVVLNDLPPLFARRIVWEGREVFCSHRQQARAFVRDVQLRAADLAPWLERMRRLKLQALAR